MLNLVQVIKNSYLSRRVFFFTLALSTVVIVMLTSVQLYYSHQNELKTINRTLDLIQNTYAPSIASSVYSIDEQLLEIQLASILNAGDISYVEVVETRGNKHFISSAGNKDHHDSISKTFPLQHRNPTGDYQTYGKLTVIASLVGVNERLKQIAKRYVISGIIITALITIGLFLFIHFILTRHLIALADFTDHLSLEDLDQTLNINYPTKKNRNDELSTLINAITKMRDRIQLSLKKREKLEQEIHDNQQFTSNLITNIPGVVYRSTSHPQQRMMIFVSDGITPVTGYKPSDLEKNSTQSYSALIHDDDRPLVAKQINLAIRDVSAFEVTYRLHHASGNTIWVLDKGRMVNDEQDSSLCIEGIITDISEQKQAQEDVHKLAMAVEQSPESIVITSANSEIEYVNKAYEQTTGYSRQEVMHRHFLDLQSSLIVASDTNYEQVWQTLGIDNRGWKGEVISQKKNRDSYTELVAITPIRQDDDSIAHYLIVKEDITEKKKLAQELDDYRHLLEELVEKRTQALADSQQQAESANQAKSSFLANMSHEIRTPMNAIVGLTHLLRNTDLNAEQLLRLEKIEQAGKHLLAIINDILDISKIEADKLVLEDADFHLSVIFDYIYSVLSEQAKSKGIELVTDQNSVPHWLKGDYTRLRQALLNYAGNAIKFTENGTIYIRSKKLEEHGDDLFVRFEVEDTGPGMTEQDMAHLFNAFEQADISTTRKYGGTGLGLTITKRLVQLMGGEVGVESELGKGSKFWFTARLKKGKGTLKSLSTTESTEQEQLLRNHCTDARILLVEDNEINREVALELLHAVGLDADTAENGQIAVEKVCNNHYDLILMDIQMPVMDGMQATKTIRSMSNKKDLAILAMTANAFQEDKLACIEAGMNDFIAKPVDPEILFNMLAKWLPRREKPAGPLTHSAPARVAEAVVSDDLDLLNKLAAIEGLEAEQGVRRTNGKADRYLRLLQQFTDTYDDRINNFKQEIELENIEAIRRFAHTLKGTASTLSFNTLQQTAIAYEASLTSDEICLDKQHSDIFINTCNQQTHQLRQHIEKLTAATTAIQPSQQDIEHAHKILRQLMSLVTEDDASANILFIQNEQMLKRCFGDNIDSLSKQMKSFDYPQALTIMKSIPLTKKHA
ncbi:hypothetical protein A9Q78_05085 [Methylophaga sp. 41_12_T18]|nr:hypothetical protein A9Q78_05085 [Methylophaga sp. 41_12_T18]